MKILFAMGDSHLPQYTGGAQSSSHELALELIGRGHKVSVLCRLIPSGIVGLRNRLRRRLLRRRLISDHILGYPVYRQWDVRESIAEAVSDFKPDVAVVQIGQQMELAAALRMCGTPTLVYLRNVEMKELNGDPRAVPGVNFIANSEFTAQRFRSEFGLDPAVIPPLFVPERYCGVSNRSNVTFINPYPEKGCDIALKVAEECPDIPFCFVESWTIDGKLKLDLLSAVKKLPNVTLKTRMMDMKGVYAHAKMILMPSRWEEAWGRVASEAQFSGIPVVASNRGGLPESVGPGGVLLDPDGPIELWVEAVRRLWTDADFYNEKSAAALNYSKRPEIDRNRQILKLLELMAETRRLSASMGEICN